MERGRAATEGRPYGVTGKTSCNRGRAATEGHPPFVDHDARRARRPGAPPHRTKPPALTEAIPKPGGRGKPLPYGMNEGTSRNGGRASLGLAPTG